MPNIYGNCSVDVPKPACDPCLSDAELGGIRGVAFIHKDAIEQIQANPQITSQWALFISQGLIYIIPETRGTFNGGEVVTRPGFGNRATINVGFNFSLEYDDPSYKSNCGFYNAIMQSGMYYAAYLTETQVKISSKPVQVTPTAPVTDDVNEQAVWHIIVTWTDKLQPCPFEAPEDVFICAGTEGAALLNADASIIDVENALVGKPYVNYQNAGIAVRVNGTNQLDLTAPMKLALLVAKVRPYPEITPITDFRLVSEVTIPAGQFNIQTQINIPLRSSCVLQCEELAPGTHNYIAVPCSTTGSIPSADIPDTEAFGAVLKPLPNSVITGEQYGVKAMVTVNGISYIMESVVQNTIPNLVWSGGAEPATPCTSAASVIFEDTTP